jgi:hypothetical protein
LLSPFFFLSLHLKWVSARPVFEMFFLATAYS